MVLDNNIFTCCVIPSDRMPEKAEIRYLEITCRLLDARNDLVVLRVVGAKLISGGVYYLVAEHAVYPCCPESNQGLTRTL